MSLYHFRKTCQVPICKKPMIFGRFSADFLVICGVSHDTGNPSRLNLAMFPIHVKGFVSGKHNFNKHALARTDFQLFEISCKPFPTNKPLTLFSRLRDEGNQQQPSSSACRLTPPIPFVRLARLSGTFGIRSFRIIPGSRVLFGRGSNGWKLEETPEQSSRNPSPHKSYPDEPER